MSFFQDIFSGARRVLDKGKDVLQEQLGSEIVYQRDQGIVSDTGNKPKILGTAKDIFLPGRGFSDEEIKEADVSRRDMVVGAAKTGGEIAQGALTLTHMLGNKLADTLLPGFDAEAAATSRGELNERVSSRLAPTTAGQAKAMRAGDVLGFLPVGSVSKVSKFDKVGDVINARKTGIAVDTGRTIKDGRKVTSVSVDELVGVDLDDTARESVEFFEKQLRRGEDIGPIEVMVKDGNVSVTDGAKRLQAARNQGVDLVDVVERVPDVKPKPPVKTPSKGTAFDVEKFNPQEYVQQQVKARDVARKGESSFTSKLKEVRDESGTKIVDLTSPIERRYFDALKKDKAFASKQKDVIDIRDRIDRVLNTPSIAHGFVKDNGLTDVIQGVDNIDEFDQFLIARHSQDVAAQGIKTGRNLDADNALVDALGPKYQERAAQVTEYNNRLLDYMVESGLIHKNLKDGLKKKYPNYVPLQRIFTEAEKGTGFSGGGVASIGQQSVIQKIVGSERKIDSSLESIMQNTNKAISQGEKNKAAREIIGYKDIKGNPFELRRIGKTTDAASDKGTISVLVDGKKQIWETNKEVARAAKKLEVERINILGKIFASPVRLARVGITGIFPPFTATNVARDQLSAFIFSRHGMRSSVLNPRVWLAGLGGAIKHGKLYDEMISEGALMTHFDLGRSKISPNVARTRSGKDAASRVKYLVKNPSELFRALEDTIGRADEITRMQQYKGAKEAALGRGLTEQQARNIAARSARENSVNFARRGEWGTVMNSAVLYLNAGIQGSRLLLRNLKNHPKETTAKIATTLMLPASMITYWNMKDDKRREAYADIPEYEKENNIIILPENPVKDENGRWNAIKIPLQPGVGRFASMVRRPIEASYGGDPVSFKEAADTFIETASPINPLQVEGTFNTILPQAVKPGIQAITNTNLFTGQDIVPKSKQDLPAEQQVKSSTSGTAEKLANKIGVSPIKMEQFIKDTFGSISSPAINAVDKAMVSMGVVEEGKIGGETMLENLKKRFVRAAGGKTEQEQLTEIYDLKKQSRGESKERAIQAQELYDTFKSMSKEEANAEMRSIKETDKVLYDKIVDIKKSDDLGLSSTDRALKQLGVTDGTRAQYIYDQAKTMSKEEANAYIKDLRTKKVISDNVLKQIKELKANDTI